MCPRLQRKRKIEIAKRGKKEQELPCQWRQHQLNLHHPVARNEEGFELPRLRVHVVRLPVTEGPMFWRANGHFRPKQAWAVDGIITPKSFDIIRNQRKRDGALKLAVSFILAFARHTSRQSESECMRLR